MAIEPEQKTPHRCVTFRSLADPMRAAWIRFAATGSPSTAAVPHPHRVGQESVRSRKRSRSAGGRAASAVP